MQLFDETRRAVAITALLYAAGGSALPASRVGQEVGMGISPAPFLTGSSSTEMSSMTTGPAPPFSAPATLQTLQQMPFPPSQRQILPRQVPAQNPSEDMTSPEASAENTGRTLGSAHVHNACSFPVNSNIVHAPRPGANGSPEEIASVLAPGASLSHPFAHDPDMGISWKIWRQDDVGGARTPVQLEYTWKPDVGRTWYDLSMIDAGEAGWLDDGVSASSKENEKAIVGDGDGYGDYVGEIGIKHPFGEEGLTLSPKVVGGNCAKVNCVPGDEFCTTAYNTWNDWGQQHDCGEKVDLTLTLCG